MAVEFDLDLEGYDEDVLERGGSVPPDYYRCLVEDVYEDHKNQGVTVVKFKVAEGDYHDYTIFDRLYDPEMAADSEKAETSRRRLALYCKRLGLLAQADYGGRKQVSLADAIGRECYVQVKERTYTDKNNEKKTTTGVDYAGVYPLGHEKLPVELGGKPKGKAAKGAAEAAGNGRVPPQGGSGTSPATGRRKVETFDDLV